MPRFNTGGRSSKFAHMVLGQNKNSKDQQDDRSRFRFTLNRGGIQRNRNIPRIDATGDTVMDGDGGAGPSTSGGRQVHFSDQVRGGRGRGRNRVWRKGQGRQGPQGGSGEGGGAGGIQHQFGANWHRILFYNGKAYDKAYLLPAMAQLCRLPFVPICYSIFGANTAFFVEKREEAQAISECSTRLATPDGVGKIAFRITPCGAPATHVDQECEDKIKAVLDRRYDANLKTLNLENFAMSPELVNDYFLPLYRGNIVQKLTDILQPHLDGILGLDLSNNKLPALDVMSKLINKCKSLRALNLRGNRLKEISSLDRLSSTSEIIELILEGNPLANNVQDRETFISSVRKRFPKVIKLDGLDLPAPLSFDVSEPTKVPDIRASSFCNDQAKAVVLQFWELYVSIYDSNDRQTLHQAYHDNASMSMMASYTGMGHVSTVEATKKLSYYIQDSRNMTKQSDKIKRFKLLHQGKLDIVSFINKLPKTTHDLGSFVVDMPVAVENFILFTVNGIFKEREERGSPYRYFARTFTLVPQNQGFVIINEMLYITNPTNDQIKKAFRQPQVPLSASLAAAVAPPPPVPVTAGPGPPPPTVLTDAQKQAMVTSFAAQSGMNELYSQRCLHDNGWDFERSAAIFLQMKESIPAEAFAK